MALELKESVSAKFVPKHLLKVKGNDKLQSYFRFLIEHNYRRGINKVDYGRCAACYRSLTIHDHPRLSPAQKKTKKLQKLLAKADKRKLSKFQDNAVKKFLKSSSHLIAKCPSCGHVNRQSIVTNEQKFHIKDMLAHEVAQESMVVPDATESSKKKKKKKKRKTEQSESYGSLKDSLPPSHSADIKKTLFSSNAQGNAVHNSVKNPAPKTLKRPLQSQSQPKGKKLLKQKELQAMLSGSGKPGNSTSLKDFLSSL
ncbi:uncharacterized protein LOC101861151 [Aplysia californica]|uniref:Uncharacterized protein LOC101861151 n=1 Tax=Aplysia californica TaxID=6500 RepID=A0ABM1A7H8_APLCA|nr:uncharacterized protein LOC101861151 [Aplysia californica]